MSKKQAIRKMQRLARRKVSADERRFERLEMKRKRLREEREDARSWEQEAWQ